MKKKIMKKTLVHVPEKKTKLNIREKKFATGIINGLSAASAMRAAGYAESTATHKQHEKLAKVGVYITDLMEQRGLTDDRLLDTLEAGLVATKNIPCTISNISKNNDPDGQSSGHEMARCLIEVKDFAVRHKFLETALKLRGHLQKQDNFDIADSGPLSITVRFVTASLNGRVINGDGQTN